MPTFLLVASLVTTFFLRLDIGQASPEQKKAQGALRFKRGQKPTDDPTQQAQRSPPPSRLRRPWSDPIIKRIAIAAAVIIATSLSVDFAMTTSSCSQSADVFQRMNDHNSCGAASSELPEKSK